MLEGLISTKPKDATVALKIDVKDGADSWWVLPYITENGTIRYSPLTRLPDGSVVLDESLNYPLNVDVVVQAEFIRSDGNGSPVYTELFELPPPVITITLPEAMAKRFGKDTVEVPDFIAREIERHREYMASQGVKDDAVLKPRAGS